MIKGRGRKGGEARGRARRGRKERGGEGREGWDGVNPSPKANPGYGRGQVSARMAESEFADGNIRRSELCARALN
jgi:hypothetical protein